MSISRLDTGERLARLYQDSHDIDDDAPTLVTPRPSTMTDSLLAGLDNRTAPYSTRLSPATDYGAFLAGVGQATATRDAQVRARLDDLRDRFSGPYVVDGAQVSAQPMFRMTTHKVAKEQLADLNVAAHAAKVNPNPISWGQGTPRDLVKITQKLIDMGRLPPPPGELSARIRQMQWDHGIGVDCAGYCREALLATSPRILPLRAPGMESFRDLDSARAGAFMKSRPEDARPGDLVTLDPIAPEVYGHNVIVYDRSVADETTKRAFATLHGPAMQLFLASGGPHHVIQVDSSWGANGVGAPEGGYRRDTWLFDESTKQWGSFTPAPPHSFVQSAKGPAGDAFHAVYRPR